MAQKDSKTAHSKAAQEASTISTTPDPNAPTAITGADALVATLAGHGVTHCFANPGTSEMHLVQALDANPAMKSVLCLAEIVVSGAADGFARMAGVPAMTLLHLGPGYTNACANIHNARRAFSPMINVIGDHATHHRGLDAPLASDIETLVTPNSKYVAIVEHAAQAGALAAHAFAASMTPARGPISLILCADAAWNKGGQVADVASPAVPNMVPQATIKNVAAALKKAKKPAILVGGDILADEAGLALLSLFKAANIRVLMDSFPTRQRRGQAIFQPDRMLYFAEAAIADLLAHDLIILAGTADPCAFFAYPNTPSRLIPDGVAQLALADRSEDNQDALARLAGLLALLDAPEINNGYPIPECPTGELTPNSCALSLLRHMPENAIISDDAVTAGLPHFLATKNAVPHDWLFLTGGAIGQGMPVALGAALAAPKRKVIALSGDGAGAYSLQALWSMAREKLPIVIVIFANHRYRILSIEMARTGAGEMGPSAAAMLSLNHPNMDWVALAKGFGVDAISVDNAQDYDDALAKALAANVPMLIEAQLSQ